MEPLWAVPKDSHSPSPAVGQVRGAEQPPAHGSEATSDEPWVCRHQDCAGCSQDIQATAGNAHGSWYSLPARWDCAAPSLCWQPALWAVLSGLHSRDKTPARACPLLIPLPVPAQLSSEDQHPGFSLILCLGAPRDAHTSHREFTAWKITHTGTRFWEHISILQACLKGKVPTELRRGNPWEWRHAVSQLHRISIPSITDRRMGK